MIAKPMKTLELHYPMIQFLIMADRGFNIQEMLACKGVKVNVPPFMNESGQFNESELLETRRIASLRIHVERGMERIKNYHILDIFCLCDAIKFPPTTSRWLAITMITNVVFMLSIR